ncbi:uncharacterized protein TRIADDRAFT_54024 [Trichoplax adhaerens]|uniref:Uncharacterized protein n=1 Tax=Trichoplax adhaerens TaxID=10228 RepID=B3RQW7_TRIAD|nr:predicted protein [Trichoplax adhaerens]EDV26237.1 predicted protein [Trichoplax adhaerens]|eukprot:XP_002110233.1 predicted protein [Trichoplax adhaerens]
MEDLKTQLDEKTTALKNLQQYHDKMQEDAKEETEALISQVKSLQDQLLEVNDLMEVKSLETLNRDQNETDKLDAMIKRNKNLEQTISNLWEKLEQKNNELKSFVNNSGNYISPLSNAENTLNPTQQSLLDLPSAQISFQALLSKLMLPSDLQTDLYNSFHQYYNSVSCLHNLFELDDNAILKSDGKDESKIATNESNTDLVEKLKYRLQGIASSIQSIAQYIYKLSQALGVDGIKNNRNLDTANSKDHDLEEIKSQLHQNYNEIIQWISIQNSLAVEKIQKSKDQRIQQLEEAINNQDNQLIQLNQMKDKFENELLTQDRQSTNHIDKLTQKLTDFKDENSHLNRKCLELESLLKKATDDFHQKNKSYVQQCQGIQFKIEDMIVTNRQELDLLQKEYELNNSIDGVTADSGNNSIQLLDTEEIKIQRKESLKELEMKWEELLHSAKMEIVSLKEQHNHEIQLLDEKYRADVDKLQKKLEDKPFNEAENKNQEEELISSNYGNVVLRKKNRKQNNMRPWNTNIKSDQAIKSALLNGDQSQPSSSIVTDKLNINTNRIENLKVQFHQEITNLLTQIDRLIVSENADNQQLQAWATAIQQLHTVYQAEVDLLFQEYKILQQSLSIDKQQIIDNLTKQHHENIQKLKETLAAEAAENDSVKRKELEDHFNENLINVTETIEKQCQQHYKEELSIIQKQMNKEIDDMKKRHHQEWLDSQDKEINFSLALENLSVDQQNYHQILLKKEDEISSRLEQFCVTELELLRNKLSTLDDKTSIIDQLQDSLLHYKRTMLQFMFEEIQKYYQSHQDVINTYHHKVEAKMMNLYQQGLDSVRQQHEDNMKKIKEETTATLTSHHEVAMAQLKDNYQKELLSKMESARISLTAKLNEQHEEELNNLRNHLQDTYENSIRVALDELKRKEKLSQEKFDERVEKTVDELLEQRLMQYNNEIKKLHDQTIDLERKLAEQQNINAFANVENGSQNVEIITNDTIDNANDHTKEKSRDVQMQESKLTDGNAEDIKPITDFPRDYQSIVSSIEYLLNISRYHASMDSNKDSDNNNTLSLLLTEMVFEYLKKLVRGQKTGKQELSESEVEKICALIEELEKKWTKITRDDWISVINSSALISSQKDDFNLYDALPYTLTTLKNLISSNTNDTDEISVQGNDSSKLRSPHYLVVILETVSQLLLVNALELALNCKSLSNSKSNSNYNGGLVTVSTTEGRQSFPPLYKDFMLQLISQLESMKKDLKQVLEYFSTMNHGTTEVTASTMRQYLQPMLKKIMQFIGDPTVVEETSRPRLADEHMKAPTIADNGKNNNGSVEEINLKIDRKVITSKNLTRDHFNYLEAMIVQNYQFDRILDLEIDRKSVVYSQIQLVVDKECLAFEKRCKARLQQQLDSTFTSNEINILMEQCNKAIKEIQRYRNQLTTESNSKSVNDLNVAKEKFYSDLVSQKQFATWQRHRIDDEIICSLIIKELFIMQLDQLGKQQECLLHKLEKDETFTMQQKSIINQLDVLDSDLQQENRLLRDWLVEGDTYGYNNYTTKSDQLDYNSYPSNSSDHSTISSYVLINNMSKKGTELSSYSTGQNSEQESKAYSRNVSASTPIESSFKRVSFTSPARSNNNVSSCKRSPSNEGSLNLGSKLTDSSLASSSFGYHVNDANTFYSSKSSRDKYSYHSISNIASPTSNELNTLTSYNSRNQSNHSRSSLYRQQRLTHNSKYWEEIQNLRQDLALHQHLRSQQDIFNLK